MNYKLTTTGILVDTRELWQAKVKKPVDDLTMEKLRKSVELIVRKSEVHKRA